MKKNKIRISESAIHNALQKSIKKVIKEGLYDDNLHDDLNLTSTSLDNENNFDDGDDEESNEKEQEIIEMSNEARELATKLYYLLDDMCEQCKYVYNPSFDEYQLEETRDTAESVMNDLDDMFDSDDEM